MSDTNSETKKCVDEEENLLEYLENTFKDRYTEADEEFKAVWVNDLPPPPIFVDWLIRCENKTNFNYRRGYKDYQKRDFKQTRYTAYDRPGRRPY